MSFQECALYGDLVRHLRDRFADRLTELQPADPEVARSWVDAVIREWFFAPSSELCGDTPREVIWRERRGEPNVLSDDHQHEAFFDDCPVCQAMRELDDGGEWHWHYDDGGSPLIAEYDPEGWEALWRDDAEPFGPSGNGQDGATLDKSDAADDWFSLN